MKYVKYREDSVHQSLIMLINGNNVYNRLYAMEVMAKARPIAKAVDVL